DLAGLRVRGARPATDVPVLGHVLSDLHVSGRSPVGRTLLASLPRDLPSARTQPRTAGMDAARQRGLPPSPGADRPGNRAAPGRQASTEMNRCYPVPRPQPRLSACFRRIAGTD